MLVLRKFIIAVLNRSIIERSRHIKGIEYNKKAIEQKERYYGITGFYGKGTGAN